jgi:DNA-binding transcriptional LysR family regulator
MNVFQLECFLAVADHLSFARAAEEMHITQPAVSHQIHSLEGELGVKLFRRTTRFVELTTEGMTFLDDARNIVSISRRAVKRFESADDQEILNLSVGCDCRFRLEPLAGIMEELRKRHPNLHPRLVIFSGKHLLTCVEDGTLDAALTLQDTSLGKSSLVYRELKKVPVVCLCREGHPFAGRPFVTQEEVQEEELVVCHPSFTVPEVARIQWQLVEKKKPSQLFFCEFPESAVLLTRAGYGVSVLPDILSGEERGIWKCPIQGAEPLSLGIYCKSGPPRPLVREFLELMRERENP